MTENCEVEEKTGFHQCDQLVLLIKDPGKKYFGVADEINVLKVASLALQSSDAK